MKNYLGRPAWTLPVAFRVRGRPGLSSRSTMELLRSQRAAARQRRLLVHELQLRSSPSTAKPKPQVSIPTRSWNANKPIHGVASQPLQLPTCCTCNHAIQHERITVGGKTYHRECFACANCEAVLRSLCSKVTPYFEYDGDIFCTSCFRALYGNPCSVCARRNLTWKTLGGWTYCAEHERDKFHVCHACSRIVLPRTYRYM